MKRIIYDYENPHIVGKASRSFPLAKVIISIILVALSVALIYILFFRKTSYALESKEYFTVISGDYASQNEAEAAARQIKDLGGGGYVIKNEKYSVVVSVYESKTDADAVASRYGYKISSSGKIKFKVSFSDPDISKKAVELTLFPERIFGDLYNVSLSLDKGELSEDAAIYSYEQLCAVFDGKREDLAEIKRKYPSDKLLISTEKMFSEIATSLSEVSKGSASATSRLKYCLIDITYIYKNYLNTIS